MASLFARAVCVLLLLPVANVAGQQPRDSAVARAVSTLRAGQAIRVALLRERWTGAFRGARGDTLFLGPASEPPMAIRFNAVDTLWRRTRAWRRGAIIGAAVGAVPGVLFFGGTAVAGGHRGDVVPGVVVGLVSGAAAGALYGAAVGALFRAWQRTYP